MKAARDQRVTIPIVPGLKILSRRAHLTSVPTHFNVAVPEPLIAEVGSVGDDEMPAVRIRWACEQTLQLFEQGVPSAHRHVMQHTSALVSLLERLKLAL